MNDSACKSIPYVWEHVSWSYFVYANSQSDLKNCTIKTRYTVLECVLECTTPYIHTDRYLACRQAVLIQIFLSRKHVQSKYINKFAENLLREDVESSHRNELILHVSLFFVSSFPFWSNTFSYFPQKPNCVSCPSRSPTITKGLYTEQLKLMTWPDCPTTVSKVVNLYFLT